MRTEPTRGVNPGKHRGPEPGAPSLHEELVDIRRRAESLASKANEIIDKLATTPAPVLTLEAAGDEDLLVESEAAKIVKMAPRTLANLRSIGGGPPFKKLGRNVRYAPADLREWLAASTRRSTSDKGVAAR